MGDPIDELKGKIGLDVTDLKTGIAEINRNMRIIESGFRASAAALGDWSKDASGLESRIKALNGQIELQNAKVRALTAEYKNVAAEKGTTSRAAQDLQIKLNKETETLNRMQTELNQSDEALKNMGNESATAGGKVGDLATKEELAANRAATLKSIMGGLGGALKVGAAAILGLAAAAASAAGAMAALVIHAGKAAGELVDLRTQTGISTTELQEMAFIGSQIGVSTETIASSMAKLTRSMAGAKDGTGAQAEAFAALGVSVTDVNGNLRSNQDVFDDSIAALGGVANETERDVLAMALFGKSAQELNPLIKTSADEMDAMRQKAHDLGAVVEEEDVSALEKFDDTLAGLKSGLQGTAATLAATLLPAFQGVADGAETYLGQLSSIVKGADGDITKMATGVGQLLGTIATQIATQAPKLLQGGLAIIQGLLNAILTALPALIPAAVAMITSLVQFLVQNLPLIINAGIELVLALVNGILPMLPMLIEAALQMVITLALGIAQALPALIPAIVAIIPQIILILIQNLPLLIQAALELILALATGLIAAIPILLPYIPQIVVAIYDALIVALPMILQAAIELIMMLVQGITDSLPVVIEAATGVVNTVTTTVKGLWGQIMEIGRGIIDGVWAGILAAEEYFTNLVREFFHNILRNIMDALGMHSPSTVWAEVGKNMVMGLGEGFADGFGDVEKGIRGAVAGLGGMEVALAGGPNPLAPFPGREGGRVGGRTTGGDVIVTVHANVASQVDMYMLAQAVAEEIVRRRG